MKLFMINDFASIEDVGRFHHRLVDTFVVEFSEFVPFSTDNNGVGSTDGVVWIVEDFDGFTHFVGLVSDAG